MTVKMARNRPCVTVGLFAAIALTGIACVPKPCVECRTIDRMEKQVQPKKTHRQRFETPKGVPVNQSKEAGMVS